MLTIVKILRIIGFYIGFFVACTIFAAIALDSLSDGFVALFVLLTPVLLVWWYENRKRSVRTKTENRAGNIKESIARSSPARRRSTHGGLVQSDQDELSSDMRDRSQHEGSSLVEAAEATFDTPLYGKIEEVSGDEDQQARPQEMSSHGYSRIRELREKLFGENSSIFDPKNSSQVSEIASKTASGSMDLPSFHAEPASSSFRPYQPQQDNSELIRSGKAAREALETASHRRAQQKLKDVESPQHDPLVEEAKNNHKTSPSVSSRPSRIEELRQKLLGDGADRTTRTHEHRRHTSPNQKSSAAVQGWVPNGQSVTIAGRQIGGMVYVGVPPHIKSSYYGERCRAYIDPAQHVAQFGSDKNGEKLPYWPSYADIPSVCRATYLDWLASGREDARINPGYMFLFFYGLERRFMIDDPSLEEKQEIVDEVARLKALFHESHSVQRYLGDFLDIACVTAMNGASSDDPALRQSILENHNWEVPTTLKVLLGGLIAEDKPLDAELLRLWFVCDPQARLRTPARRCGPEFAALFEQKFSARYPDGLKVRTPRRALKISYRAASHEFEATIAPTLGENGNTAIPDISALRSPIDKAQAIADEAMDELEKFSRYLGRNAEGRGTIEAQALLPTSLWSHFPSEELERLKAWAREKMTAGSFVPALDVVERLEGTRPDKLGKRHLTGAADALGRIGIGIAPDPRFSLRGPKADEPVVLFKLEKPVEQLEEVSPAYREQLFEIALATLVAHSDAKIVEAERTALRDKIAHAPGLTAQERIRLEANLAWYLDVPPDLSWLRSRLKKADAEHHLALRAAVVAIAHADSVIQSEEVACIEKVYQALGIDAGLVYADLHAGGALADAAGGPVRVKPAEDGASGEAILAEPVAKTQPLDAERIAAIRSDTARVSSVLGEIFETDEYEYEEAIDAQPVSLSLAGLEVKQALIVKQIVTREHWTTEDFDQLAEAQGLLPTGALEAINEWAFDRFEEALLDEYDGYDVSPLIAEALKVERAEGESGNVEVEAARA